MAAKAIEGVRAAIVCDPDVMAALARLLTTIQGYDEAIQVLEVTGGVSKNAWRVVRVGVV